MMFSQTVFCNRLSAIPTEGVADFLHNHYKTKLINSFNKLILYVVKELSIDASSVVHHLKILADELPQFLTPWSYHSYFKLRNALMNDEVEAVKNIITELNDKAISCFQQHTRTVQPAFTEDWELNTFNDEVEASFGEHNYTPLPPCKKQFAALSAHLENAIKCITTVDGPMVEEINVLAASIKLLNNSTLSATSPKFFGAIYISMPDNDLKQHQVLVLVDHLVHETSHLFLNTILIHDPLILNDENARYASPIRNDPRPMLGIYHAVFVLSRVIRILKKMSDFNLYHDMDFLNKCIKRFVLQYEAGFETIKQNGILTDLGDDIFKSTRECSLS